MTNTLRDALTTAADNPAPRSTVDIEAALTIGLRRRVRKLSAVAVMATCVLVATVSVGSAAVRAGPPTGTDPATSSQPPPKPCPTGSPRDTVPSPGAELQQICVTPVEVSQFAYMCGTLDLGFVEAARSALPPVGTWSAPRLAYGCDPSMGPSPARDFAIEVATEHGTGLLWVGVVINPGVGFTRAPCDAAGIPEGNVCTPLPEGNLRHWAQENGDNRATLDTPNGAYIQVGLSRCVQDLRPGPCAGKPAYTSEQLSDLALAVGRTL